MEENKENPTEKVALENDKAYAADRTLILKIDKEDAYILKSFLYGDKNNRRDLFDFFARGKTTKVPSNVMTYLMAYLLKFNTNDCVKVDISTFDDETVSEPEYYLMISAKEINI